MYKRIKNIIYTKYVRTSLKLGLLHEARDEAREDVSYEMVRLALIQKSISILGLLIFYDVEKDFKNLITKINNFAEEVDNNVGNE